MKNPKGFINAVALLFIVVIAIGAVNYFVFVKNASAPTIDDNLQALPVSDTSNQNATAPQNNSQTKTYTNSQYGFSFQYPSSAYFATSNYGSIKPFLNDPIAYIQLSDQPQTEGYMTINVSSNPNELAKCTTPGAFVWINNDPYIPEEYREKLTGTEKHVNIGGLKFLRYDVTSHDLATGVERQYSALHDGVCYDIVLTSFPSACISGGCDDKRWSLQTETALMAELDIVAQSFRFTQ